MFTYEFGDLDAAVSYTDSLSLDNPNDDYQFNLTGKGQLELSLTNLEHPIDWVLEQDGGDPIAEGTIEVGEENPVAIEDLLAESYVLRLTANGETPYDLSLEAEFDPLTGESWTGGYLIAEEEQITVDYLIDGGRYEGELGIFSLEGLEEWEPGSSEWIEEAARRSLSSSTLGHVVIDEAVDAPQASHSFDWEQIDSQGSYPGKRSFTVQVGDRLGLILVPDGSIEAVFDNPDIGGRQRPLFSMATANPDDVFHFGQIANLGEDIYILEDQRVDLGSDKDYNDIGFRIEGVRSQEMAKIEDVIADEYKDWPEDIDWDDETSPTKDPEDDGSSDDSKSEGPKDSTPEEDSEDNAQPEILELELDESVLESGDSLRLTGVIEDQDGAEDIQNLTLILRDESGEPVENLLISDLTADGDKQVQFDVEHTLDNLDIGDYQLEAIASDQSGTESSVFVQALTIKTPNSNGKPDDDSGSETDPESPGDDSPSDDDPNSDNSPPEDLRFSILPVYTTGERIQFQGGRVFDADGVDDLTRVDFWLKDAQGQKTNLLEADVTEFTQDDQGRARFNFDYDLSELTPGRYELNALAYDYGDVSSNLVQESFVVISEAAQQSLADPVRFAIGDAVEFNRYSPEVMAEVSDWLVWLTPGEDPQTLADSLAAIHLGANEQIDNTYIWQFPSDWTVSEIVNLIDDTPTLEIGYPDTSVPLRLLDDSRNSDYLEFAQWSLHEHIDPSTPSNVVEVWEHESLRNPGNGQAVEGHGVTVAIVDDGLQYTHIEFDPERGGGYRRDLSWDFSDKDNDPFPQSQQLFETEMEMSDLQQLDFQVKIPVNLTGVVQNVSIDFDHEKLNDEEREILEDLRIELTAPSNPLKTPEDWLGVSWGWYFPGWDGLDFEALGELNLDKKGNWSFETENPFVNSFAGGEWSLDIYSYGPPAPGWQEVLEKFKQVSLEVTTLNPHGTAVAGIVGDEAETHGTRGIAPQADLAALRLIGNIDAVTASYDSEGLAIADSLYEPFRNQEIDIFNNSWGPFPYERHPHAIAALAKGAKTGLNGLGNSYIFSAGNDRSRDLGSGLGYANVNHYALTNDRHAIAVGAITRYPTETGEMKLARAPYSNPGAFISAFSNLGLKGNSDGTDIVTTGINPSNLEDDFYVGYPRKRIGFGGTSAAAPFISGVVALMRDVNPNLSNRDIQHILAETAYQVDPDHEPDAIDPDYNRQQSGWIKNGAGYQVSHQYGFGAINPVAAVERAADWTPVGPEVSLETGLLNVNETIPNGSSQGLRDRVDVADDITLEWVEVSVQIDHEDWNDLTVVLTSPEGTESVLRQRLPDLDSQGINIAPLSPQGEERKTWVFTTPRLWGESSQGEWTLEVFDEKGNDISGEWEYWHLDLHGTEVPAPTPVTLDVLDSEATQDGDAAVFAVTREENLDQPLQVNYEIAGTAINGVDYQAMRETVTLEPGQRGATISVVPNYNLFNSEEKMVEINLTVGEDYVLEGNVTGTATITDHSEIEHYSHFIYQNPDTGNLYMVTEPDTWYGAQAQAEALGGNLVTINNQAEQDWLLDTFGKRSNFLIGLTDNEIYSPDGEFNWISGEPLEYLNWHPSEPNNSTNGGASPEGEDSGVMNHDIGNFPNQGKWNDLPGRLERLGIVEVNPDALEKPLVTMMATDATAGEDGNVGQLVIQRFDDVSEELIVSLSVTGPANPGVDYQRLPEQVTIPAGEVLATVPISAIPDDIPNNDTFFRVMIEEDENYAIAPLSSAEISILDQHPINRVANEVIARDVHLLDYWTERWQNGESLEDLRPEMIRFAANMVSELTSLYQGLFERNPTSVELDEARQYLGDGATLPELRQRLEGLDPDDWIQSPNYVYTNPDTGKRYTLTQPDTWLGAQEQAKAMGGNLVTIDSDAENQWLLDKFGQTSNTWIGLNDSPIYNNQEGKFTWVSGDPVAHTNWAVNEPNNALTFQEGEDFGEMHRNGGQNGGWNDMPPNPAVINFPDRLGIVEFPPIEDPGSGTEDTVDVYFAEDLNPGGWWNFFPGGWWNGRLNNHPKTDQARADFLANLVNLQTADFEEFENNSRPQVLDFGETTATLSYTGDLMVETLVNGTNGGMFPTSGDNYLLSRNDTEFTIEFSEPQSAFGLNITDAEGSPFSMTLHREDGTTKDVVIPVEADHAQFSGSVLFFGVKDEEKPFKTVTIHKPAPTERIGLDELVIGEIKV